MVRKLTGKTNTSWAPFRLQIGKANAVDCEIRGMSGTTKLQWAAMSAIIAGYQDGFDPEDKQAAAMVTSAAMSPEALRIVFRVCVRNLRGYEVEAAGGEILNVNTPDLLADMAGWESEILIVSQIANAIEARSRLTETESGNSDGRRAGSSPQPAPALNPPTQSIEISSGEHGSELIQSHTSDPIPANPATETVKVSAGASETLPDDGESTMTKPSPLREIPSTRTTQEFAVSP